MIFSLTGRGGLNLYSLSAVERAWGHARKNSSSNGVLTPCHINGGEAYGERRNEQRRSPCASRG